MKILVTGAAGFIGYHTVRKLIRNGHEVIGLDNINYYYDLKLKYARLNELGIGKKQAKKFNSIVESKIFPDTFQFILINIEDKVALPQLFKSEKFELVCHLAAQVGVRYSLNNPEVYIDSNIVGYLNILE